MSLLENIYQDDLIEDSGDIDNIIEDHGEDLENPPEEENNDNQEDEVDDENKRKVKPIKKIRNPRLKLDPERLRGPRGISTLEDFFKDVKFKGKNHEKEDLNLVMWKLEHWCHRLFPKYQFDDCLEKIEKLGTKKIVQTYVKKIRLGMVEQEQENKTDDLNSDDEITVPHNEPMDIFDQLLNKQINKTGMANEQVPSISTEPSFNLTLEQKATILRNKQLAEQRMKEKLTQSQFHSTENEQLATASQSFELTEEQRERMLKNRMIAEQRRLEKYKSQVEKETVSEVD